MVDEEEKAINVQIYALILSLFSVILSIIITYNQKLKLEKKKPLYNAKDILNITVFNRILILALSIIFLYVNFKLYEISKNEGEDLKSYKLQIFASILTVVAGLIALYVVSLSSSETILDIENPII